MLTFLELILNTVDLGVFWKEEEEEKDKIILSISIIQTSKEDHVGQNPLICSMFISIQIERALPSIP